MRIPKFKTRKCAREPLPRPSEKRQKDGPFLRGHFGAPAVQRPELGAGSWTAVAPYCGPSCDRSAPSWAAGPRWELLRETRSKGAAVGAHKKTRWQLLPGALSNAARYTLRSSKDATSSMLPALNATASSLDVSKS